MNKRIPIYEPYKCDNTKKYVLDCINSNWISSKGDYIGKFEKSIKERFGIKYCTSVSNGTSALFLALKAIDINRGDEIITTNFTYVASTNSILSVGAKPVFVDIRNSDLNIDTNKIVEKITTKTKAILYTNVYGFIAEYKKLKEICKNHNLILIEDAAESLGGKYKNKFSGTLGDISTFSFFGNKTITTGEGGMVMSKKQFLIEKVKKLKNQGNSKSKVYFHDELGYNFRMTNIQAAIGLSQIEKLTEILELKRKLQKSYLDGLSKKVKFLKASSDTEPSYWIIPILFKNVKQKQNVEVALNNQKIETRPLFYPIDTLPFYETNHTIKNAKSIFRKGLILPSYPGLSENQIEKIKHTIIKNL